MIEIPRTGDPEWDAHVARQVSLYLTISQDQVWHEAGGNTVRIDDMTLNRKRNLLRWLAARADTAMEDFAHGKAAMGHGDEPPSKPGTATHGEAIRWLHETPLGARLLHDINHRIEPRPAEPATGPVIEGLDEDFGEAPAEPQEPVMCPSVSPDGEPCKEPARHKKRQHASNKDARQWTAGIKGPARWVPKESASAWDSEAAYLIRSRYDT